MTRRAFLALATGIAGALAAVYALARSRMGRDEVPPDAAGDTAVDGLTDDELRALTALAVVLFPPTTRVPVTHVERTAEWLARGRAARMTPPPAYRAGLVLLADEAVALRPGNAFVELSAADRERVVTKLMAAHPETAFHQVAADLIEGLYASLPGWRLVGYDAAPGMPNLPLAYTTPPDTP
jgi:hypothetical protein